MEKHIFRQIKLHIPEVAGEALLYVTDDAARARKLVAEGKAVLGVLTEENAFESFEGVRFLTEEFEESDTDYLERVYRRYAGLPWNILETERLLVRESTVADLDAFYDIYKVPAVGRFMHDLSPDRATQETYMERYRESMYGFYEFGIWTVILKETGEIIGRAGFAMREGFTQPELGFVIGKSWQGQGLAKEVCNAILEYGKNELYMEEILAFAEPENTASAGLLVSLGFEVCGRYAEKDRKYIKYRKNLFCTSSSKQE